MNHDFICSPRIRTSSSPMHQLSACSHSSFHRNSKCVCSCRTLLWLRWLAARIVLFCCMILLLLAACFEMSCCVDSFVSLHGLNRLAMLIWLRAAWFFPTRRVYSHWFAALIEFACCMDWIVSLIEFLNLYTAVWLDRIALWLCLCCCMYWVVVLHGLFWTAAWNALARVSGWADSLNGMCRLAHCMVFYAPNIASCPLNLTYFPL